ncbi:Neuropeptide-Like Protein [Caenorhabditis elegans]|uniref:Neuropeptide-Like Protein n=1 Tax=Caenorhabditis elegans TaxID=6239 RepID=A0A3B1DVL3_CAEEL|nr:Neuropeptide-Like Protein [Caenorhabditis elegans]VAY52150.1 Neuropeptide-Like Protein [Caenorhabditis elegans]|eukprot:NP_001355426.1 Uncharacterized protein CELE_Y49F6B.6 [Caenorhabditis elegans]
MNWLSMFILLAVTAMAASHGQRWFHKFHRNPASDEVHGDVWTQERPFEDVDSDEMNWAQGRRRHGRHGRERIRTLDF